MKLKRSSIFSSKPEAETIRLTARDREWIFPRPTLIVGIINVSPDSFSGDGVGNNPEAVLKQAERLAAEGADMLDIGAVSTRPGAEPIAEKEELERLFPALEIIRDHSDLPISVDTTNARVAERALRAGGDFINDISGLGRDPDMVHVIARYSAGVIIMHSRGDSRTMHDMTHYGDLVGDIGEELGERVERARSAGIQDEHIVIDPGLDRKSVV